MDAQGRKHRASTYFAGGDGFGSSLGNKVPCARFGTDTSFRTTRTGRIPERVGQYRLNADKCLELAETFKDPDAKRTLFAMAAAWLTLAAQRVKNIETVVPPLSPHLTGALPGDPK